MGEVLEDGLDLQFGLAVWVDRVLWKVLYDGQGFGFTIGCAGGGEDKFVYPCVLHGKQELDGIADIVFVVFQWFCDGFADVCVGGEVHDDVNFFLTEDFGCGCTVSKVLVVECDVIGYGCAVSVDEIVEYNGMVAG